MRTFGHNDEGHIHDDVIVCDSDGDERFRVVVIAGTDAGDHLGIQLHSGGISISLLIGADEARRLGSLLHEAAADTLSRPRADTRGKR